MCTLVHVNKNLSDEGSFHFCGSAIVKASTKFYKNTLPSDMIFTKDDTPNSDEKVEKLTGEFNIHYRACIGELIYLFSTRVDLSFAVHNLEKFSANPGKLHSERLVYLLRYILVQYEFGIEILCRYE